MSAHVGDMCAYGKGNTLYVDVLDIGGWMVAVVRPLVSVRETRLNLLHLGSTFIACVGIRCL